MTALQALAKDLSKKGWNITIMTEEHLVASHKKEANGCLVMFGILGLLFFIIPGILILLLAYASRDTETVTYTRADAETIMQSKLAKMEQDRVKKEESQAKRLAFKQEHKYLGFFGGHDRIILFAIFLVLTLFFIFASLQ
jgi:hypothetical protein